MKMLAFLIDRLLLVGAGAVCAALAWLFWWYFQARAFDIFATATVVMLFAENWRLRRALRDKQR
nr:hypothetical protein [uncultured Duganella sp.]